MTHVNVSGGTNAGWRSPFEGNALPWQCGCRILIVCPLDGDCFGDVNRCLPEALRRGLPVDSGLKTNPGHLAKCPACGTRRP